MNCPAWQWFTGKPEGKCAVCGDFLRKAPPLVTYSGHVWHVHCLLDHLTAKAAEASPDAGAPTYSWHFGGSSAP